MRNLLATAALTLGLATPALAAGESFLGGNETFRFTIGGIIGSTNPSLTLNGTTTEGTPISINQDTNRDISSFSASGEWRFARRHRVSMLWYGTKRSNTYVLANDVVIDDTVIPAGATLTPEVSNDYFFVNYRYSFVKTEKVEIAALLGLYGSNWRFDITAVDFPGNPTRTFASEASTTLPLPVVGASLDWYITPRWTATTSLSGMAAKIGDVDGSTWVFTISSDYMIWRNIGVGLAYMHATIDADVTKPTFNGNINFTTNNFLFYGVFKF